jgi:hypothetical protein
MNCCIIARRSCARGAGTGARHHSRAGWAQWASEDDTSARARGERTKLYLAPPRAPRARCSSQSPQATRRDDDRAQLGDARCVEALRPLSGDSVNNVKHGAALANARIRARAELEEGAGDGDVRALGGGMQRREEVDIRASGD